MSWMPSQMHRLILHAAVDRGPSAEASWRAWIAAGGDVQTADHASARLFPLIARNLADHAVPEPELARLRGVRRRAWVEHTSLMRRLAPYAARLVNEGVPILFLKGIALAPLYYGELGLRALSDVDVLVKPTDVPRAVRVLAGAGLAAHPSTPGTLARALAGESNLADEGFKHALAFVDRDGLELDLHWAALHTHVGPASDAGFWRRAVPCKVAGISGLTLAPCDLLLHAIVHGVAYSEVASIRWIPDALAILRAPGVAVDWQVFVGEARRRGLEPPLFEALGYLVREFHAEVPAWVVRSFARPWSWMARQRYAELAHEWGDVRTPGQVVAELAQHLDGRRPRDAATVALRFFRHRLDPTRPTHMARQLARPLLILLPKPARDAVRAWGRRDRFPCPDARA